MSISLAGLEGTYELLMPLPRGGGITRYRARHREFGGDRLIDILPVKRSEPGVQARLAERVAALRGLEGLHLPTIELAEVEKGGEVAYVVLHDRPGRPWSELFEEGERAPLGLAYEMALLAATALAQLHRAGLCHGEIGPGSLALGHDGAGRPRVWWNELGLTHVLTSVVSGGPVLGKVRYAAPESFSAVAAGPTPAVDVYVLGLLLYELFTGRFPIEGQGATSLVAGHLFRPPLALEESDPGGKIPPALGDVLLTTLAKEPEHRYMDGEALLQVLLGLEGIERSGDAAGAWLARQLPGRAPLKAGGAREVKLTQTVSGTEWFAEVTPSKEDQRISSLARIERALLSGDLGRARSAYDEAERTFGGHPELEELGRRIEATLREHQRQPGEGRKRASSLVEKARTLSGSEDFQGAKELLAEAVGLAPDHSEALLLSTSLEALMAWRDEEDRGKELLDRAIVEVQSLLHEGRTGEALANLQRAIFRFGEVEELQALRRATADAFVYGDAFVEPPPAAAPRTRPISVTAPTPEISAPAPGPGLRSPPPFREFPAAGAPAPAPTPASLDDLPLAGLGAEEEPVSNPAPAPMVPQPRRQGLDFTDPFTWLLILLIVVIFLTAGLWLGRQGVDNGLPEPRPETRDISDVWEAVDGTNRMVG